MPIRRIATLSLLSLCGIILSSGFIMLGNWQLERRVWKLDLIERIDSRVHAPAEIAPSMEDWAAINQADDEYRHVLVDGQFLLNKDTLVVAATELGSGYWVMTPFQRRDNSTVLINRGYIGQGIMPLPPETAPQTITGLLRLSEPNGSVLRENSPTTGRWYSRDVAAIADHLELTAAPYFIDADAKPDQAQNDNSNLSPAPVAGLTVVKFHNSHMVYAVTWFSLALSVLIAGFIVWREERRRKVD
ncbi:Uncharacterised protein [Zhongshania aliphaticivorans]|uniref:SURF1-like protein n=1 Tax=Zhongshania aliphaticivorans TaxID=1470434 RepID=A0A5S9NXC4_9GAMM|nr:SURF1 family protein [Zhongshania aliphaticivorans]CAA0095275.1 Uncharacterised protein [Zhongshania aliphaticivorans]CAA0113082.1 Uncharacterised protein [Zhongshania aliphaticivorans]